MWENAALVELLKRPQAAFLAIALGSVLVLGMVSAHDTQAMTYEEELDQYEQDQKLLEPGRLANACLQKIGGFSQRITVDVSELDLDAISVSGTHSITIPLKKPHETITSIWLQTKTLEDAITLVRLLRAEHISAVSVMAFNLYGSASQRDDISLEDLKACQKDDMLQRLRCTHCKIMTWVDVRP